MRKLVLLTLTVFLMTGLASSAFIEVEKGQGQKADNTIQKQAQSQNSQSFVSKTGDTLRGALDMAGFGITGLSAPENGTDAVTKNYVDQVISNNSNSSPTYVNSSNFNSSDFATEAYVDAKIANSSNSSNSTLNTSKLATKNYVDQVLGNTSSNSTGSNSSSIPGLSQVLSVNNVASSSIGFLNGIELGTGSSADSDSIAVGRDAEALKENSVAIGKDARANSSGEVVIGSNQNPMDLRVTGNLEVEGNQGVWTTSINTSENGTFVNLTEEDFGSDYTVSATPVGSMENIGVFNKTSDGFDVKSTGETRADITVFH
jgi:hypothetical protein